MVLGISRPWRHPKTHTYWFRRRVPKELLFLVGRTEERKSLRTKEPTVARTRYLLAAIEVEERWSLLRRAAGALASEAPVETCANAPRSFPGPPEPQPAAPSPRRSAPWRGTFEAYAKDAALAPSTVKRWTGVFVALEEACGTDDLELVTRDDLISWKRDLLASGRDPRTVRDAYVAAVKALMNWAVAEGRMTANPAADVVVAVPDKPTTRDRDFTDGEAYAIFRASLAPQDARLSREHAAARRWIPWLDLETVAATRKGCAVTRSFSDRVEDLEAMEQAVATHAARLGEKLRRECLATDHLTVFFHTSEHDRDRPQRSISTVATLPEASNDTMVLIKAAIYGVRRVWKDGYRYSKAGIVTTDLVPLATSQRALIGQLDRERSGPLMDAIDACNRRFGRGTVVPAIAGVERARKWSTKFDMRSPRYTTRLDELLVVGHA